MKCPSFLRLRRKQALFSKQNTKRVKELRRSIQLEMLENRQVMAGDIAGTVFNDLNANGLDDPSENGIPGVTVFVDANASGTLNPGEQFAVTDTKGKYTITGVPAGIRELYEVVPVGFSPTPGFSNHQTIEVRDNKETRVKFGNVTAPVVLGNISGNVFVDANANGISESGEDGLVGWTMFIDNNGDGALTAGEPTSITDIHGDYLFTDVPQGAVTVYELPQAPYRPITGGLFPTTGVQPFHTVNVVGGRTANSDFANGIVSAGNLQGTIVNDINGDGIRGATESPMSGITVYVDVNDNLLLDAGEPTRVTDASGNYSFVGIRSGTYRVTEVLPPGYVAATTAPASSITAVFNGSSTGVNFFNLIPTTGSISGVIFNDLDGNGLQAATEPGLNGWQVYLDRNFNNAFDAGEPQTTTAADGTYSFSSVPYGLNMVRDVVPADWVATNPVGAGILVSLLNGENRTDVKLGNRERIGTIQGTVWNDDNGDGVIAATESGLNGRTVFLDLNNDGSLTDGEPTAVTNAAGAYQFTRVPVGSYQVAEVVPSTWITSVGKPTKLATNLTIGGTNTIDFYNLVPRLGSISGKVFSDLNSNSVQDAGEAPLEGFQVWVDINHSNTLDDQDVLAITDASGQYTLGGVPYGNQTVHQELLPSYTAINHPGGIAGLLLLNGESRAGVDFATKEPVDFVISGMAFFDANHNGTRDAGERGLSGVQIYIDANNNGSLDSTEQSTFSSVDQFFTPAVNELGTYSFTHLPRGNYTIREIVPSELDATPLAARTLEITVGPSSKIDANFANVFRANEIHGVVFDDTDNDHSYDLGEHTRSEVTVYIDSDRDDVYDEGEPTTVTGVDGSYAFVGLVPGAYIVREVSDHGPKTYPTTGGGILWPAGNSNPAIGNVTPGLIEKSLTDGESYTQTVSLTLPNSGGHQSC